jgi:hypothetical protein
MHGNLDALSMTKLSAASRAAAWGTTGWVPAQKYFRLDFATAAQMDVILSVSHCRGFSLGGVSMLNSVAPAPTKTSRSIPSLINVSANNTISHVPYASYEAVTCVIEKYAPDECSIGLFASKKLGSKLYACIAKYLDAMHSLPQNWSKYESAARLRFYHKKPHLIVYVNARQV